MERSPYFVVLLFLLYIPYLQGKKASQLGLWGQQPHRFGCSAGASRRLSRICCDTSIPLQNPVFNSLHDKSPALWLA